MCSNNNFYLRIRCFQTMLSILHSILIPFGGSTWILMLISNEWIFFDVVWSELYHMSGSKKFLFDRWLGGIYNTRLTPLDDDGCVKFWHMLREMQKARKRTICNSSNKGLFEASCTVKIKPLSNCPNQVLVCGNPHPNHALAFKLSYILLTFSEYWWNVKCIHVPLSISLRSFIHWFIFIRSFNQSITRCFITLLPNK